MNRKLRILHRYLGVFAAFFIAVLTITGVLLNHTEALQLDEKQVSNPLLLKWYGIEAAPIISYQAGTDLISFDGLNIYLNREKTGSCDRLTGALSHNDILYISCEKQLLLLTPDGQLIETIDTMFGLPVPVSGLGISGDNPIIEVEGQQLRIDSVSMSFSPITAHVETARPVVTPATIQSAIRQQAQAHGLNMERLVQDIHSGRILGITGVIIMDLAGILLVFMAFSGLWVWLKRR